MMSRFFLSAFLVSVLFCAACENAPRIFEGPNAFPTGYVYHKNEYKSPPGEKDEKLDYEESKYKTDSVAGEWALAIDTLLGMLESQMSFSPDRAYYIPPLSAPYKPHEAAFDYYLRERMREAGYTVQPYYQDGAMILYYDATPVDKEDRVPLIPRDRKEVVARKLKSDDPILLKLSIWPKDTPEQRATGVFGFNSLRYIDLREDTTKSPLAVIKEFYQKSKASGPAGDGVNTE